MRFRLATLFSVTTAFCLLSAAAAVTSWLVTVVAVAIAGLVGIAAARTKFSPAFAVVCTIATAIVVMLPHFPFTHFFLLQRALAGAGVGAAIWFLIPGRDEPDPIANKAAERRSITTLGVAAIVAGLGFGAILGAIVAWSLEHEMDRAPAFFGFLMLGTCAGVLVGGPMIAMGLIWRRIE